MHSLKQENLSLWLPSIPSEPSPEMPLMLIFLKGYLGFSSMLQNATSLYALHNATATSTCSYYRSTLLASVEIDTKYFTGLSDSLGDKETCR